MKKLPAYEIEVSKKGTRYTFESIGIKGNIQKIVEFQHTRGKTWNLAFGDLNEKGWADEIISNNWDMRLVLQTNEISKVYDGFYLQLKNSTFEF